MTNRNKPPPEIAPSAAGRYLLAMLAGIVSCFALFIAMLAVLDRSGHLPPPAFANSLCTDEKLNFLRNHKVDSPNLLVVGSSVAWRHIDGETLASMLPGAKPLNAGFCGLTVNQSAFVAGWMLDRYPTVQNVLLVVSPQDLTRCKMTRTEVFDRVDADRFVFGGALRWPYYFKYFDPISLARAAPTIKARRVGQADFDDLVMTRFGDGPLDTTLTRGIGYEERDPLDPACFDALRSLVTRLRQEGKPLSIVTTPIHPVWLSQDQSRDAFVSDVNARLLTFSAKENVFFWNAATEWVTPQESFVDAIHLRWSVARKFTAAVARKLSTPLSDVSTSTPAVQHKDRTPTSS